MLNKKEIENLAWDFTKEITPRDYRDYEEIPAIYGRRHRSSNNTHEKIVDCFDLWTRKLNLKS